MKSTEYEGRLVTINGELHTKFTIGCKVVNSCIEDLVLALGGKLVKTTTRSRQYLIKGNRIYLGILLAS